MNTIKFIWLIIVSVVLTSCEEEQPECKFKSISRFDVTSYGSGDEIRYVHRVLVKDYASACFDSLTAIRLFNGYRDTVSTYIPVDVVSFHSSGEWYFHPNPWIKDAREDPDQVDDILVIISFSPDSKYEFTFFNKYGDKIYQGPNYFSWRGRK